MLGNDVVDLDAAGELRHERFDARVFADSERAAILASADPERLRWMFWAAKESAFKALRRIDRGVAFAPARFVVTRDLQARAPGIWMRVAHGDRNLRVRVEAGTSFVHAIAWCGGHGVVATTPSAVARADAIAPGASLREAVRRLARESVARTLQLAASELDVTREGRIPRLVWRGATLPVALSLSHDGIFVAFACQIAATAAREVA